MKIYCFFAGPLEATIYFRVNVPCPGKINLIPFWRLFSPLLFAARTFIADAQNFFDILFFSFLHRRRSSRSRPFFSPTR